MWDLWSQPGIELMPPTLEVQSLNLWITREIPPTPLRLKSFWSQCIYTSLLPPENSLSLDSMVTKRILFLVLPPRECLIFICSLLTCKTEKAMAIHSSTLAWKIPWREEPGRLWRVRHDWATSLSLFTFMHWRRKWKPTPVFLPGESQGQRSLVGYRLWGRTESDMTEAT